MWATACIGVVSADYIVTGGMLETTTSGISSKKAYWNKCSFVGRESRVYLKTPNVTGSEEFLR